VAGKLSDREELLVDINVTPLVDVTLVLLIIFMVTIPVLIQSQIPLELPQAGSGEQIGTQMGIQFYEDRTIRLNGEKVTLLDLKRRIESSPAPVRVLLEADRRIPYGDVVALLDLLRQWGVSEYALNIVPGENPFTSSLQEEQK